MIVSLKWLREYVNLSLSVEQLVDRLTMVGLEVEGVHKPSRGLEKVVTARVESIEPHPKADRLRLCKVTDGTTTYQIVCGAPNLQVGRVAPLALAGARLPSGLVLEETEIRGVLSQGMLCSQKELELGEDASGIWFLPDDVPVGVPLSEVLESDDTVLDISITPNRGDCLSILGIAREVSAITGAPLKPPDTSVVESGPPIGDLSSVTIEDPVGCPRYAARLIQGVTIAPSPKWLRERLEAVGLRPINNVVDVTNYILMEMGQPLHAFDFDRLREHRIVVRRAEAGERFTTLDGVERTLYDDTLLICDGQGPVAIAGIMGGLDSEIEATTTNVLIESAYFQPQSIRRSSKKLNLRTESSFRFERGVDPEGLILALDRAARLMMEVGGGEIAQGRLDVYPAPIERPTLELRVARTNRFLGTRIKSSEMADILRRLEMDVTELDGDTLQVVPPPFRPDITREVDLAEEIIRLVGYDKVPVTSPVARVETAPIDRHYETRQEIKQFFQGAGFFEVLNYSFISFEALKKLQLDPQDPRLNPVRIMNPLSEEQAVMRTTLIPGILQTVHYNFDHGNEDLRIFELSKVFQARQRADLPEEPHHLAGAMAGKRYPDPLYGSREEVDYNDVKGVMERLLELFNLEKISFLSEEIPPYLNPDSAASIYSGGELIGSLGRIAAPVEEAFDLKKPVYVFELDFERAFSLKRPHPHYRPLPKFPSVTRDMAIVVDEGLLVQKPLDFILEQKQPFLEHVEIFDIFKGPKLGPGKRSIGYRFVYRAPDRSLTDEEVNEMHAQLVAKVLKEFQATLR